MFPIRINGNLRMRVFHEFFGFSTKSLYIRNFCVVILLKNLHNEEYDDGKGNYKKIIIKKKRNMFIKQNAVIIRCFINIDCDDLGSIPSAS